MSFVVHHPTSVSESLAMVQSLDGKVSFLAGGTDLIIQTHRKLRAPDHLISLAGIAELRGIEDTGDQYRIGALTTLKTLERHVVLLDPRYRCLAEAARVVGGHQVRNIGTIGGNIVNASPAADLLPALLVLEATVELAGPAGRRNLPLDEFLIGPRLTALRPQEIVTSVKMPKAANGASVFLKFGRRQAMEISVVCVAARLSIDMPSGNCRDVRVAIGAAAPRAIRAVQAEAVLEGRPVNSIALEEVGQLAMDACRPVSDVRASSAYRARLVEALVPRALSQCAQRLGIGGQA
jgi:carbon-monoxide dehydrogenase medium subunit